MLLAPRSAVGVSFKLRFRILLCFRERRKGLGKAADGIPLLPSGVSTGENGIFANRGFIGFHCVVVVSGFDWFQHSSKTEPYSYWAPVSEIHSSILLLVS